MAPTPSQDPPIPQGGGGLMGYDHNHGRGGGGGTRNLEHIYMAPWSNYINAWRAQVSTTRYFPAADNFAEIRGFFILAAHVCCFVMPQSRRTWPTEGVFSCVPSSEPRPVLKDRKSCRTYIFIYMYMILDICPFCILRTVIKVIKNHIIYLEPFLLVLQNKCCSKYPSKCGFSSGKATVITFGRGLMVTPIACRDAPHDMMRLRTSTSTIYSRCLAPLRCLSDGSFAPERAHPSKIVDLTTHQHFQVPKMKDMNVSEVPYFWLFFGGPIIFKSITFYWQDISVCRNVHGVYRLPGPIQLEALRAWKSIDFSLLYRPLTEAHGFFAKQHMTPWVFWMFLLVTGKLPTFQRMI